MMDATQARRVLLGHLRSRLDTVLMTYNPYRAFPEFAPIPTSVMRSPILSGNDKIVFGALVRRAGKDGRCYPSQKTLAEDCGLSVDQIRYALQRLAKREYIRVRSGRFRGAHNVYEFLWHPTFPQFEGRDSGPNPQGWESTEDSRGVGNGSRQKDSLKGKTPVEPQTQPRPQLFHKKPPQRECSLCDGTGWKQANTNGVSAVERCNHA